MTEMGATVLIDITQYVSHPAATGVQRVLAEVLLGMSESSFRVYAGYMNDGVYSLVQAKVAADAVAEVFAGARTLDENRLLVWNALETAKEITASAENVDLLVDLLFLPEPTFRQDILAQIERLRSSGFPTAALVCDLLPATAPQLFRGRHQATTNAYFRQIARMDNVAAISMSVLDQIEERLRRSKIPNSMLAPPGVSAPDFTNVNEQTGPSGLVVVGTIEPRKRVPLVVDVMQKLWAEGFSERLTIVGRPGWEEGAFLARLDQLTRTQPLLTWYRDATDQQVYSLMGSASALIYVSDNEGYGLPPLEALAMGVPVIAPARLPSLEAIEARGQIRLASVNTDSLTAAIRRILNPTENLALRDELRGLQLPTRATFRTSIETWLARCLAEARCGEHVRKPAETR